MKAKSAIKISEPDNYDKINIYMYQQLINKLIYLTFGIKPDIAFAIRQFNRHNANLKKAYLQTVKKVV